MSSSIRWYVIALIVLSALVLFITTKQRSAGHALIWVGLGAMTLTSLLNDSTWSNILLFPVYAIVMLGGLQLRTEQGSKIFTVLVIIQAVGVIIMNVLQQGEGNGGFIDPANYNAATALTLIGFMLSYNPWKWMIVPAVIIALFFMSAEEAIILLGVLGITVLIRHDWSKKAIPALLTIIVCLGIFFGFHQPRYLYAVSSDQVAMIRHEPMPYQTDTHDDVTRGRWDGYKLAVTTPTILGHGFDATWNTMDTIHDIPLRVLYDLGAIGLLAFLLCLVTWTRSTGGYVVVMVIAMMVFDHYFWTQIGIWLWALWGMTYRLPSWRIFNEQDKLQGSSSPQRS